MIMRLLAIGLAATALAGCATQRSENDAPTCAGKDRRPINIHPSVLPPMGGSTPVGSPFVSVPLSTPTVGGPLPVMPAPAPTGAEPLSVPPEPDASELPIVTAPSAADAGQDAAASVSDPSPFHASCE